MKSKVEYLPGELGPGERFILDPEAESEKSCLEISKQKASMTKKMQEMKK